MQATSTSRLDLRVHGIESVAHDTLMFTLVPAKGNALPAFTAGSHIELQLTSELARSYSLLNDPAETHSYQIAVHLSPSSRGGSAHMHSQIQEGQLLQSTAPRNLFALDEGAQHSCLIAGGIGITPLMSMAKRLTALNKPWELHYCARTPEHAGWVQELQALGQASGNSIFFHFDEVAGGKRLDMSQLVKNSSPNAHFYCCGPSGMLEAFEHATAHCQEFRHIEYFTAKNEASLDGGYEIELARSGKVLLVAQGQSILDVVTAAGVNIMTSCREGICGSCETRILCGEADHRDSLLTSAEQAQNTSLMICCSGSKSPRLVLDL